MKKMQNNEDRPEKYEKIINNLKHDPLQSVAASAKNLCCEIMNFQGQNLLFILIFN